MDGHTDNGAEGSTPDAVRASPTSPGIGMSRRDFATKFGLGSAAAVGLAVGAPNIRTIAFATKAKAGSPAPRGGGSTTTTTTVPGGAHGKITVSDHAPCAGDSVRVQASGFVPHTAVTLELDSPGFTLGNTTADSAGSIDVQIDLTDSMAGTHKIVASGIQQGGRSLLLSTPVNIKTQGECRQEPQGSTTIPRSTSSTTVASTTQSTTPVGPSHGGGGGGGGDTIGGEHIQGGNGLAFTGTDAIDLALIGAAATVGGRLLYGLARPADDEEEDE